MNLVLGDVQQDALDRAAGGDGGRRRAGAGAQRVDVSKADQMEALAAAVKERFGAPNFVFNNAGVGAGGLVWENTRGRLGLGAGRQPVGRGARRAPVHADDAGGRREGPGYRGHIVNTASMAGLLHAAQHGRLQRGASTRW